MSRSKRARRVTGQSRGGGPDEPDDFAELTFGYMARWGRFVVQRGTLSPEEHAEMVGTFLEGASDLAREQEIRRARLLEILDEADSVDLLARASLTYMHIDPDTFKEWESDRSPAHIEYLALQALGAGLSGPKDVDPMRAAELTGQAIEIVREMFESASMLLIMDAVRAHTERPNDPTVEYALRTRLQSLGVRGTGYAEHLIKVIHGCFDPLDYDCRELLGFTATEALTLTYAIADLISTRVEPLQRQVAATYAEMLRQLKRERRRRKRDNRHFPDWLLDLPPTEAKRHISMLATIQLFADSRSLAVVTSADLASHCSVDSSASRAFLDAFSCPRNLFVPQHHSFPTGAHPLTIRPILSSEDGYLVPAASSMIDAIRPRMEDLLQQNPGTWDRYVYSRGQYLEREATLLLTRALPGSRSWNGIKWQSASDESDLDGLIAADDLGLRLQCKAGRLTAPARRGAPDRMKRDVGQLIEEAARQHQALALALTTAPARGIGFTDEQAVALEAVLQFEAIVCLDDVTVWSTETHELKALGALPEDRHVPWVLSLTDLMAVVDLLDGAELVLYLIRRQRIERVARIEAHDELDWVGHFIAEGLFFDRFFDTEDPPDSFRLLSYTEPIDAWYFTREGLRTVEAPKPSQKIPRNLASIVRRLEQDRPRHWVLASVALLNGDEESWDQWDKAIDHISQRVRREGWSNATQVFDGRIGVTLYIDLRKSMPAIQDEVAAYCRRKAEELDEPNWIGIGEGARDGLFVIIVESNPETPLIDVFLEPPAIPPAPGDLDGAALRTTDGPSGSPTRPVRHPGTAGCRRAGNVGWQRDLAVTRSKIGDLDKTSTTRVRIRGSGAVA